MNEHLDERDQAILAERVAAFDARTGGIRTGDYVRFSDGVLRRVSYVWREVDRTPFSVQTSDGGSWYLGSGYTSFSGGLHPGIDPETLSLTDERRAGDVWFFHHDWRKAHNAVAARVEFRVYECSERATR